MATDEKKLVDILSRVPLFQSLNQRQLGFLARRFTEREYTADTAIVTQGNEGLGFFVVMDGQARAVRTNMEGTEADVNEFNPGDFFGELALLDDGPRTASVITTEPTKCLVLTRWDFFTVLRGDVDTTIAVLQTLAQRFRRALDAL